MNLIWLVYEIVPKVQISTKGLPYHVLTTEDEELITGHNYLVFRSSLDFEKMQQLPPTQFTIFFLCIS